MQNSIKLAFSFLFNAIEMIESEQENFDEIFKLRHAHFKYAKPYTKNIAKRIYNELENHYYTYTGLFVFMLYRYAFNKKVLLSYLKTDEILNVLKMFTKKQLKKDVDFIKKMKLDIDGFFEIRESGEPIIYQLIKQEYITSAFFVRFFEKTLTSPKKDVILNTDYKRYEYAMRNIQKTIKGGFND